MGGTTEKGRQETFVCTLDRIPSIPVTTRYNMTSLLSSKGHFASFFMCLRVTCCMGGFVQNVFLNVNRDGMYYVRLKKDQIKNLILIFKDQIKKLNF